MEAADNGRCVICIDGKMMGEGKKNKKIKKTNYKSNTMEPPLKPDKRKTAGV